MKRSSRLHVEALLGELPADAEGELRIITAAGTDRVLIRGGRVVAVHLRGHFDPLLERLMRAGALDRRRHRDLLERLAASERLSGELARAAGIPRQVIDEGLASQMRQRVATLDRRLQAGARVVYRARPVAPSEVVRVMPRRTANRHDRPRRAHARPSTPSPNPRCVSREELVAAAMRLHPDRNPDATPAERAALQAELARLTAAYHGLKA